MIQCERCKCFPTRYFVETSANQQPRMFCSVCVISIAAGYLYKAQQRKVQQTRYKTRRPIKVPEATQ